MPDDRYHLAVFDHELPLTRATAALRYDLLQAGAPDGGAASARIVAFVDECRERWPAAGEEGSPWAEPFGAEARRSEVVAAIRPEAALQVRTDWRDLAERHGLNLYDPQTGEVVVPSRYTPAEEPKKGFVARMFRL